MAESAQKEKPRRLVERLILIPIAYMLGHLCVLGFHTLSYSEWRDAQMILAIGILFYCAMLLALSIFYSRKELRICAGTVADKVSATQTTKKCIGYLKR